VNKRRSGRNMKRLITSVWALLSPVFARSVLEATRLQQYEGIKQE
jgi:hypothetical protein